MIAIRLTERGLYEFTGVPLGAYCVVETPELDWVQTEPVLNHDDPADSSTAFSPIPDDGYTPLISENLIENMTGTVPHVVLTVIVTHDAPEQLNVSLISSLGTLVEVTGTFEVAGDARVLNVAVNDFLGELNINGTWSLVIEDKVEATMGRLGGMNDLDWFLRELLDSLLLLEFGEQS